MTKTRMEDREIGRKQKRMGPQKPRRQRKRYDSKILNATKRSSNKRNMELFTGLGNTERGLWWLMKAFLIEWWG